MYEVGEDLVLIDSSYQPAGTCAACGQPIAAGEGYAARYHGRLLRFRCSGCLDSFRREPERYVSADDYCCAIAGCDESPASEWVI
jgi:hypothetical protein